MANVIIAIHGLGNKPPKLILENWWKLAIIEGLKSYSHNTVLPEFELVYWADILYEKPLDLIEKDAGSIYYIDEKYIRANKNFPVENHDYRRKVVDYLRRQMSRIFLNEDLSLNYSFITDTVIRRYFKDMEAYYSDNLDPGSTQPYKVNQLIRERLYNKLQEHRNDNIMLVSHSMGSVIAYDVLTFSVPEIRINTFITMGSPLGLPIVISKISSEQKQKGNMRNVITTPPAIIKNWFNFSDILDKVAFNYKLSDDFSENSHGIKPIDFQVINNYEINGIRNPHKSFGYLRSPEFSKILNEFILAEKLTIKQKITRKIARFTDNLKSSIPFQKENI